MFNVWCSSANCQSTEDVRVAPSTGIDSDLEQSDHPGEFFPGDIEEQVDELPQVVVAVDIDDTLVQTVNVFKKWADSKNGGSLFSSWKEYQKESQDLNSQWRHGFLKSGRFENVPPVPGAKDGLKALHKAGFRLEALSSRPEAMRTMTETLLWRLFPRIFSDVRLTGGLEKKGEVCERHGIHVLVDDSLHQVEEAAQRGVLCVLFDFEGLYGSTKETPENVERFESWDDVSDWIIASNVEHESYQSSSGRVPVVEGRSKQLDGGTGLCSAIFLG